MNKITITEVVVIQMGTTYFWALKSYKKMIATSELIDEKPLVEVEAVQISEQLGLEGTIIIEERKNVMNELIENEAMKPIPKKSISKKAGKRTFVPIFYNVHLSQSGVEEPLKRAIQQFLFKWFHEDVSLAHTNKIGSTLYTDIMDTYPDDEEEIDDDDEDEDGKL